MRGALAKMTLKSAVPCVKATSRSSTAHPQEKAIFSWQGVQRSCASQTIRPQCILRDAREERALLLDEEESRKTESMPAIGFFHRTKLLGAGVALISRLPGLVGHAVDGLAALVLAHGRAFGVGFLFKPVGQAVAAEARQIHQIDVLDVATGTQMFDQAPEHGRFKFRSGFLVNRHDHTLVRCPGYLAVVRTIPI